MRVMRGRTVHKRVERVKILLVEGDPADARMVRRLLSHARGATAGRFSVSRVDRLAPALELLARGNFGVVLLDLQLPDSAGLDALAKVRAAAADVPVVVLSRSDDDAQALAAIRSGAQDYVLKEDLDGRLLGRAVRLAIERKRGEVRLLRLNRELDDFTYIASHDLKEPLRGITAYCETLLEDYREKLDGDGQRRLSTLVELCNRLETLIGDLLTYCRVGGIRPAETGIDLDAVVADVLDTLRPAIDRSQAVVRVAGRLPVVAGDASLIGMAVGNLISNGLKFNDRPRPHVQIGSLPTEPPTLYVRDNGIGIDRRHHEAIFTVFRRLHSRKKYEGTGAGLTIVRKIIQSHGGCIWLKSQPGRGSTFFFTLAPADRQSGTRPPHWLERSPGKKRRQTHLAGTIHRKPV